MGLKQIYTNGKYAEEDKALIPTAAILGIGAQTFEEICNNTDKGGKIGETVKIIYQVDES